MRMPCRYLVFRSHSAVLWNDNIFKQAGNLQKKKETFSTESFWHLGSKSAKEIDLMREKIVLGKCCCRKHVGLAHIPKCPIRNATCFHMAVCVPSKAYHHSNYSSEGDKRCQHSISSCKQIMLRGLDDVCLRNEIIWNQFCRSLCGFSGSSASRHSWDESVPPLEGSWL